MCIYEYTVTAKFLAMDSHSNLPGEVRKEEAVFEEGEEMTVPRYIKTMLFYYHGSDIKEPRRLAGGDVCRFQSFPAGECLCFHAWEGVCGLGGSLLSLTRDLRGTWGSQMFSITQPIVLRDSQRVTV